jgi:hypothetical protein
MVSIRGREVKNSDAFDRFTGYAHTPIHTPTITQIIPMVGDMEDVRSVSGFRGGDGRGIKIADMQEIGYQECRRKRKEAFSETKSSLLLVTDGRKIHSYWSRDQ